MEDKRYTNYLTFKREYWQIPFIGRAVNDKYEELFDHNGNYPSDNYEEHPEYFPNGIILNLNPSVRNGKIWSISCYKVCDNGMYVRSTGRSIDAHDRKIFRELLNTSTNSIAGEILENVLSLEPNNGWKIKRISKKSISMIKDEEKINIPKSYIEEIIDVGRSYPDILYNEDAWEVNSSFLKMKYKDALIALLSNINRDDYAPDTFRKTAMETIEEEDKQSDYKRCLIEAVKQQDYETVQGILPHIKDVPSDAISIASSKADSKILSLLLSCPKIWSLSIELIAHCAIDNNDLVLLKKATNKTTLKFYRSWVYYAFKNKKPECVAFLLENGCHLKISYEKGLYKINELLYLVEYKNVVWPYEYIKAISRLDDSELLSKIIKNIHGAVGGDIDWPGYDQEVVEKLAILVIRSNNENWLTALKTAGYKVWSVSNSDSRALFNEFFNKENITFDELNELFGGVDSFCKCILKDAIKHREYDLCEKAINVGKLIIDDELLKDAVGRYKKSKIETDILKLLIRNFKPKTAYAYSYQDFRYDILECNNIEAFEYYLRNVGLNIKNDRDMQDLYEHFVWYSPNVERAKLLVEICEFDEHLIKDATLAQRFSQGEAFSLVVNAVKEHFPNDDISIFPNQVTIKCVDDNIWDISGKVEKKSYRASYEINFHAVASYSGRKKVAKIIKAEKIQL